MRRLIALIVVLSFVAAACGGDDSDSVDPSGPGTDGTEDGPDDNGGDADGGGAVSGEGGGEPDQGLVETLGLPECPVGAHLEADGVVEIDFWHGISALAAEAMQDLATAFNASQDKIVVNVEPQGSYRELLTKYRESINFDDLPAVAIIDKGALRDMADSGTVLPAQSCVEAEGYELSSIDELIRSYFSIEGALYPAAMNVSTPVLYYKRGDFEAAGLDPDDPPETLEELRDAARAIKDAGVADTPLSLLLQGEFVETWLQGAGIPLVNADNGRAGNATAAAFNTPQALELFTLLQQMSDEGLVLSTSNTPNQVGHYLAVLAPGTASMVLETSTASTTIAAFLGGTSNLASLVEEAEDLGIDIAGVTELDIDVGAAAFPGLEEAGKVFISGGAYYMTDSGSDAEKAAAWEFMKFVNMVEQQKTIHLKGSYLPISDGVRADAEVQAVWETDAAGQWLAIAQSQLASIDPDFPGAAIGPFTEQREIFNQALEELMLEGRDPADVLADAEADLNDALQAYVDANF